MKRFCSIALLVAVVIPTILFAEDEPLEKTVTETVEIHQETQQSIDAWDDERTILLRRLALAEANVAHLTDRKQVAEDQYQQLTSRVVELERRLAESGRLEAGLADSLRILALRLSELVERDLPFLHQERTARLDLLEREMIRPDLSSPEKLRRLLEALQIEAQYGGDLELYQDRIVVAGDSLYVDLLRVGRLAVYWRTPDGKRGGQFDIGQKSFVELPGNLLRSIDLAMEIAVGQRSTDLIDLPLGRINR